MRAEQRKVVVGMVAASRAREAATGKGLQDTGSTAKAFAGEEVDWYCCNVGAFHVKRAMDPAVALAEDESIREWITGSDRVVVRAVAKAVGMEGLKTLVAQFMQEEQWLDAAKVEWATITVTPGGATADWRRPAGQSRMRAALSLIEEKALTTHEAQQIELGIRMYGAGLGGGGERQAHAARVKALMKSNSSLKVDSLEVAMGMVFAPNRHLIGQSVRKWDAG